MKKTALILVFVLIASAIFSKEIPKDIALKVAKNHYYQSKISAKKSEVIDFNDIKLQCILDASTNEDSGFYIFNVNEQNGFVIVSADDNIKPILAYSLEAGFNIGNIAPSQQYLLDYYSLMIQKVKKGELVKSDECSKTWQDLTEFTPQSKFELKTTVPGLLDPIKWNQSNPYNAMCPTATGTYGGYGGRCPVGCVAIAMLQIMKYYSWPNAGMGSYTHLSWDNGGHGDFTVDFSQQTYDWNSMPYDANQENDELAKTCFQAGVAVKMHWAPEGSGAWPEDVAYALVNYFSYQDNIDLVVKDDYYDEEEWKSLLRDQIDQKMPIFYVGYSDEAGHAWNCDGYQGEDHFHMNWGWGGYGNGFYTLEALGTSATPGSGEGNYSQWQHALINIFPDGEFPSYCNDITTINGTEGAFDDGSAYQNYQNNSNCTYIIEPDCKQITILEFTKFDLASGDVIQIWDGSPEDENLIATLSSDNPPAEQEFQAISGKMTLTFTSDESSNSDGWAVQYSSKSCVANKILTESSGTFDDGSKSCQYAGATLCSWTIQPQNANNIYIDFDSFDLGEGIDFVEVYKNSLSSANLIETFNSENTPNNTITVNAPTAIVRFFAASNSLLGDGWQLSYNSDATSQISNKLYNDISVFPNPATVKSDLEFSYSKNTIAQISVYSVLGERLGFVNYKTIPGKNTISVSDLINEANPGIYYITISFGDDYYSSSFVISE